MGLRESARALGSRASADVVAGRYRLDRLIGSGGAADVHEGFDLRLRRPVAVKVFRPEAGVDIEHDARREAVLLARLRHPGLVTAFDAGQDGGRAFLVMELVDGPTLRRLIVRGPLTPAETAGLGRDLARALAHAHGAGIVHRDVKPSNILLDASRRPYLTDFGISRLLDATSRTAPGTLVGTAAYLSPEQVLGRPVGCPTDVYALGLVVLECLTGRLEYDGGPLEAAIARLHRPPELPPGLPRQLGSLISDMTALDETVRPDAEECARALAAVADSTADVAAPAALPVTTGTPSRPDERTHPRPPQDAEPPARPPRPVRTARGRLLLAGAAALGTAALATGLVLADGPAAPADVTGTPAARRTAAAPPDGSPSSPNTGAGSSARPRTTDPAPPATGDPGAAPVDAAPARSAGERGTSPDRPAAPPGRSLSHGKPPAAGAQPARDRGGKAENGKGRSAQKKPKKK
ncbi:protein kinase [Streptomyces sp. NPDC060194]|uniref:serine/threonine-protein kinase n=1 Tax=Streptomyces sp. NPDC060194 TaxID=3347069 RepID=UPI0036570A00